MSATARPNDFGPDYAYVEEDWRRYRSLTMLDNHWDRPGWTRGRRWYYWLITFDRDPLVHALALRCQDGLRGLATLDFVPVGSLHVTMQRVRAGEDTTPGQLRDVVAAARSALTGTPPLELTVGPLAGSTGAVRLSVGPHGPVRAVREALRSAVASVYGEASIGGDADFVPHVSVAYNNAPIPAAPVIDVVARLRSVGTVDVVVSSLSLVEMWREQRTYVWKTIDAITLTADREV